MGEESIGRESNYVLLKLNVIDIMHSYFRVIRAVQPRSDSPQYTLLLLLLFYSLPFREKSQARVLPLVFKLIFVRIKPHLSSLPFFFFFPSLLLPPFLPLLFSLPRGIGFNSKCGGCKSNRKWRDDNDGWMDGTASMAILV